MYMYMHTHICTYTYVYIYRERERGREKERGRFVYALSICKGAPAIVRCILVRCSALQCAAVCCSMQHCNSVCCNAFWDVHLLKCVAVCHSVLQCVAVCCSVLQCIALFWGCTVARSHATHPHIFLHTPRKGGHNCEILVHTKSSLSALQCAAVHCTVLQRVAV